MSEEHGFDKKAVYQIRVKGHLDPVWGEWFNGLAVAHQEDGTTLLSGPIADQPALHGVLDKIRDLGLPSLSVKQVGGED